MNKNPWAVNSVEAFSCLKCPECPFTTNQETFFQEHAVEKHTLSIALFGMIFHRNNATTITIHERFTKLRKRKSIHHGKGEEKKSQIKLRTLLLHQEQDHQSKNLVQGTDCGDQYVNHENFQKEQTVNMADDPDDSNVTDQSKNLGQGTDCSDQNNDLGVFNNEKTTNIDEEYHDSGVNDQSKNLGQETYCGNNTDLNNFKMGQSTNINVEEQFNPDENMISKVVHEKTQVIEEETIDSNEFISIHRNSIEDQSPSVPEGNNPNECNNCDDTFTCTIHEGKSYLDEEHHDSKDSDVNDQSKNLGQGKYCSDKEDKELNLSQDSALKGQLKNLGQGTYCSTQNVEDQSTKKDVEEQFDPDKNITLKDLFCALCCIQFDQETVYNMHLSYVHEKSKKPYKCTICDASFSQSILFDRHQKVHREKKQFKCDICDLSYGTKNIL